MGTTCPPWLRRWARSRKMAANRWPSSPTGSRAGVVRSCKTITTGAIALRTRRKFRRRKRNSASHEKRVCQKNHRAGKTGRTGGVAQRRHWKPALRRFQSEVSVALLQLRRGGGEYDGGCGGAGAEGVGPGLFSPPPLLHLPGEWRMHGGRGFFPVSGGL